MDEIQLRGIRVVGTHGVLPEEHVRPQPFEVDLDLSVDLRAAGESDDLADTVDYGALCDLVVRIVGEEHHALLERLATRIAEAALADDRIAAAAVTVRKLRPPVATDLAFAAVRIVRRR